MAFLYRLLRLRPQITRKVGTGDEWKWTASEIPRQLVYVWRAC
jgi:hypothetical protein